MPSRKPRQLDLGLKRMSAHGGYRVGAGRNRTSSYQSHVPRPRFSCLTPAHVTLRLADGLPSLRRREVLAALQAGLRISELAVIHFSVLSNHLHLLIEARHPEALARRMQGLTIRLAKAINRIAGRRGTVFRERYHVRVLKTPTEVRNAIRYVLLNERNHRGGGRVELDRHSSALLVNDAAWSTLLGPRWRRVIGFPKEWEPENREKAQAEMKVLVKEPRTWLLRTGWSRART
jgi:REP element-mobilizing transposase RayT